MRLLLHNIQYGTGRLRRFAWIETLFRSTRHFPNITRFISHIDPDLVGLVEVDSGSYRTGKQNQAEEIGSALGLDVCSRVKYPDNGLGRKVPVLNKQANAVLTRLPVVGMEYHDFERGFKSLVIEVRFNTFTFFLVHLALGIRARHEQLVELHDLLGTSTQPRLVAGDFNMLSGAWEMKMFLKATGLTSANEKHLPTFPSWAPCRELDFICHDPEIQPVRFKVPQVHLSDHLPLMFDFEVEKCGNRRKAEGK